MATTIDSLPLELLDEILEYLSHPRQAALVCRRWREPAQRALFSVVTLNSEDQTRPWLNSPARPQYRTKRLYVWSEIRLVSTILEACPDLELLELATYEETNGGHDWCLELGVQHIHSLKELCIYYPEFFPIDATPLVLPNLRRLDIHLDGGEDAELDISIVQAIFPPVSSSLTFLRLFELSDAVAKLLVDVFASASFPNVRHLVLNRCRAYDLWPLMLKAIKALVTLEVGEIDRSRVPGLVVAVGSSVAPTLENLIFITAIRMPESIIEEITYTIKLPNLEGLRRIEIPTVLKDELAGETGLALLDECEERSISLLCRYGYLTRSMMDEVDAVDEPSNAPGSEDTLNHSK